MTDRSTYINSIGKILNRNTVTFNVDTAQLLAAAAEIQVKINNMTNALETLNERVLLTKNYWEGKVADEQRKIFRSYKESVENSLEGLSLYIQILETIAGGYDMTERQNVEAAEQLPSDVIS